MEKDKKSWKEKVWEFFRPNKSKFILLIIILLLIFLENFGPVFGFTLLSKTQVSGGEKDIMVIEVPKYHFGYIFEITSDIVSYYNAKTKGSLFNFVTYLFMILAIIIGFLFYYIISCFLNIIIKKIFKISKKSTLFIFLILLILVNISYAISDSNQSNNVMTMGVSVIEVKDEIKILFVRIDSPPDFNTFVLNSSNYLNKIFPIGDSKVTKIISPKRINSSKFFIEKGYDNYNSIASIGHKARKSLIKELDSYSRIENVDYVIGIVPSGWFGDFPELAGSVLGESLFYVRSALVTVDYIDTMSHEVGHTNPINLCDEYSTSAWNSQNDRLSIFGFGGCPNAKNGSSINVNCLGNGCETETIGRIAGFDNNSFIKLYSLMGGKTYPDTWVTGEIYNRTVKKIECKP